MKATVHVHQQLMRKGEPAIIVRTYKGSTHHTTVDFTGPVRMVQSATPDRCGARVWLECKAEDLVTDSGAV